MKWATCAGLTVIALVAMERRARACAGCSNPNLPTARPANTTLAAGDVAAALNLTTTTMHVVHPEACPEIGPICLQRDEPPQQHDQRFWVAELRPIVAVGITSRFGVDAQTPFRVIRTTIRYRRLDGTAFTPDYENIHHRNETLAGIADPWLLGRVTGTIGALRVTTRTGFAVPLGSTEEDPFALGRAGLPHQHIQLGTGTFYPVFALDAGLPLGSARLGAYGQALVFVYENEYGYRPGNRYAGGMSADVEVLGPELRVGASSDVLSEQPERWHGVVQQDGNVGRTDVLAGASVSYAFGKALASLSVKVPIWQHFIETSHAHREPGQLTYPAIVNLAVSTSFGGPERDASPTRPNAPL